MTEADNVRNFFLEIDPIDRRFEVLVLGNRLRRIVDGIAAENEQLFHAARIHFRGQLQNAVRLRRAKKFPHDQGRADILERGVDRVGDQLHDHRLMPACQDQTCARFRDEIVCYFRQPLFVKRHRILRRGQCRDGGK